MLDRDELLVLVTKIQEGSYPSEEEADADMERLTENVADPAAMDYLFEKQYEHLSPERIVERILSYRPVRL